MSTAQERYRVVVTREGADWLADVPQLPGTHTFARSLRGLDRMVRDAVVLMADLPDEAALDLALDWEYHLGDPAVDEAVRTTRAAREAAAEAERAAQDATRQLVRVIAERGGSVRDIAALVRMSHQRVSQLLAEQPDRRDRLVNADRAPRHVS
ncbi:MAG: type II toxin-antitoxin system HicB family antitoxin [Pseudonocardia sp.]|nr:type II toxin-antitoxin system HicB family antitoxin [Pseudonocardia sp.]